MPPVMCWKTSRRLADIVCTARDNRPISSPRSRCSPGMSRERSPPATRSRWAMAAVSGLVMLLAISVPPTPAMRRQATPSAIMRSDIREATACRSRPVSSRRFCRCATNSARAAFTARQWARDSSVTLAASMRLWACAAPMIRLFNSCQGTTAASMLVNWRLPSSVTALAFRYAKASAYSLPTANARSVSTAGCLDAGKPIIRREISSKLESTCIARFILLDSFCAFSVAELTAPMDHSASPASKANWRTPPPNASASFFPILIFASLLMIIPLVRRSGMLPRFGC